MEMKWLEDFVALAETLNFSRAAELRHVTQSAFSRRIKQLEEWVGASLVDRASYPSRLTDAGQRFVPVARETLRQLYHTRRELQVEEGSDARTVRVTALHTLSFTFFPDWFGALSQRLGPLVSIMKPDSGSMEENLTSLVEGECDFLLTYAHDDVPMLLDPETFEHCSLGRENIVAVSAPDAQGGPAHRIEASRKPFAYVAYQRGSFFGQLLDGGIATRLPPFERVHVGSMSVGLKAMATAGWGIAFVPESLASEELEQGRLVRAAGREWDIPVDIRLYRSRKNRRQVVTRLWSALGRT
jgi:DNA-binding transcriptional LysR family regulator